MLIFAAKLKDMEEKRYPVIEEEEGIGMAREPIGAASLLDYTEIDNDFEPDMPIVIPASYEEALADIEQSEREFKEGRGISWENVKLMIEDRIRT